MRVQHGQAFAHGGEHAQRQAVHLHQPGGVQVVLVPLDHGAVGHGRVLHRHQGGQRVLGDHETARVLGQVPREVDQFAGQGHHPPHQWRVRVEATLAQRLGQRFVAAPAVQAGGQFVDLVRRQAEYAGHVAHRAAATVADRHGGQRGAFAAVAVEYVLQYFLAALVFEIDVDVRGLVAFFGDEALEQQFHVAGVDLGHAQHVAHRRIGGRAAALAQDLLAARVAHDIVHGEEVGLVLFLVDQGEFVLDLRALFVRGTCAPAPSHALFHQRAQPAGRVVPGRDQFARVGVLQLLEVEPAACGDAHGFGQQRRWVQRCQRLAGSDMPLAVGKQPPAGIGDGAVVADRGEGVLQGAAPAHVHVHIAAGHQRDGVFAAEVLQRGQALPVVSLPMQFHRQPQPLREARLQPGGIGGAGRAVQPQAQQAGRQRIEILAQAAVLALGGAPATGGDQLAQAGIGGLVGAQQHQLGAVVELEFRAGDQRQVVLFRRLPSPHDAGQRAFVGDRQRTVALALGACEQFLGDRRAALEAEGRQAMQFGVVGQGGTHENQPCSIHGPPRPSARV
ncbi:hypothetical protein D3C87_964330 [compost metagenome]